MKISDLVESKEQVNELGGAPMGIMSRIGTGIAAKLGSKTAQATMDVGKRANELDQAFKSWALRSGIDLDRVKQQEIKAFLRQQGLPVVPLRQPLYNLNDPEQNKTLWTVLSQTIFKKGGSTATTQPLGQKYGLGSDGGGGGQSGTAISDVLNQVQGMKPNEIAQLKRLIQNL